MDNTKAKYNVIFGFCLALISLIAAIESIKMPTYARLEGLYAAPGLVPLILAVSLLLMGISVLINGIKNGGLKNFSLRSQEKPSEEEVAGNKRLLLTLVIISVYTFLLLTRVHYILATGLFLFGFLFAFRDGDLKRRTLLPLIIAIIGSVGIYYVFDSLFMIPLP